MKNKEKCNISDNTDTMLIDHITNLFKQWHIVSKTKWRTKRNVT